jgi:hypothetical protein
MHQLPPSDKRSTFYFKFSNLSQSSRKSRENFSAHQKAAQKSANKQLWWEWLINKYYQTKTAC